MDGIDVSNWQGPIDWARVAAAGKHFAFIKASEGVGWKDPAFDANWQGVKAAGLKRGAYHFCRPDLGNGPEAEADYFADEVGQLEPGDLVALDAEARGVTLDFVRRFLARATERFGLKPVLYMNASGLQAAGITYAELGDYGLWLAAWGDAMPDPAPAGWPVIAFWQQTDAGAVDGIEGRVDLDVFNGDEGQLAAYGHQSSIPDQGPPPPQPVPPAPPAPAPVPVPAQGQTYTVQPGDSLSAIASKAGLSSWVPIAYFNWGRQQDDGSSLTDPNLIQPGWKLHIPASSEYRMVEGGDTLSAIAYLKTGDYSRWPDLFHQNVGRWQAQNGVLRDPNLIEVGWCLMYPEGW